MEVTTLTLIIIFALFAFMLFILKLFRDDLKGLRSSVELTKDTINSSLSLNTKDIKAASRMVEGTARSMGIEVSQE